MRSIFILSRWRPPLRFITNSCSLLPARRLYASLPIPVKSSTATLPVQATLTSLDPQSFYNAVPKHLWGLLETYPKSINVILLCTSSLTNQLDANFVQNTIRHILLGFTDHPISITAYVAVVDTIPDHHVTQKLFDPLAVYGVSVRIEDGSASTWIAENAVDSSAPASFAVTLPYSLPASVSVTNYEIDVPLATTLFQNGKHSTLFSSTWKWLSGCLQYVEGSTQPLQRLNIPTASGGVADLKIEASFFPLTQPRKIISSFGNVIRRLGDSSVTSEPKPASQELTTAISYIREELNTIPISSKPFDIYAIIFPPLVFSRLSSLNCDIVTTRGFSLLQHQWITAVCSKDQPNDSPIPRYDLTRVIHEGATIHRVLSGGGQWGKSADLVTIDPGVPTPIMPQIMDEPQLPEFLLPSIAPEGHYIQFVLSTPQELVLRKPAVNLYPAMQHRGTNTSQITFGLIGDDDAASPSQYGLGNGNQSSISLTGKNNKTGSMCPSSSEDAHFLSKHWGALSSKPLTVRLRRMAMGESVQSSATVLGLPGISLLYKYYSPITTKASSSTSVKTKASNLVRDVSRWKGITRARPFDTPVLPPSLTPPHELNITKSSVSSPTWTMKKDKDLSSTEKIDTVGRDASARALPGSLTLPPKFRIRKDYVTINMTKQWKKDSDTFALRHHTVVSPTASIPHTSNAAALRPKPILRRRKGSRRQMLMRKVELRKVESRKIESRKIKMRKVKSGTVLTKTISRYAQQLSRFAKLIEYRKHHTGKNKSLGWTGILDHLPLIHKQRYGEPFIRPHVIKPAKLTGQKIGRQHGPKPFRLRSRRTELLAIRNHVVGLDVVRLIQPTPPTMSDIARGQLGLPTLAPPLRDKMQALGRHLTRRQRQMTVKNALADIMRKELTGPGALSMSSTNIDPLQALIATSRQQVLSRDGRSRRTTINSTQRRHYCIPVRGTSPAGRLVLSNCVLTMGSRLHALNIHAHDFFKFKRPYSKLRTGNVLPNPGKPTLGSFQSQPFPYDKPNVISPKVTKIKVTEEYEPSESDQDGMTIPGSFRTRAIPYAVPAKSELARVNVEKPEAASRPPEYIMGSFNAKSENDNVGVRNPELHVSSHEHDPNQSPVPRDERHLIMRFQAVRSFDRNGNPYFDSTPEPEPGPFQSIEKYQSHATNLIQTSFNRKPMNDPTVEAEPELFIRRREIPSIQPTIEPHQSKMLNSAPKTKRKATLRIHKLKSTTVRTVHADLPSILPTPIIRSHEIVAVRRVKFGKMKLNSASISPKSEPEPTLFMRTQKDLPNRVSNVDVPSDSPELDTDDSLAFGKLSIRRFELELSPLKITLNDTSLRLDSQSISSENDSPSYEILRLEALIPEEQRLIMLTKYHESSNLIRHQIVEPPSTSSKTGTRERQKRRRMLINKVTIHEPRFHRPLGNHVQTRETLFQEPSLIKRHAAVLPRPSLIKTHAASGAIPRKITPFTDLPNLIEKRLGRRRRTRRAVFSKGPNLVKRQAGSYQSSLIKTHTAFDALQRISTRYNDLPKLIATKLRRKTRTRRAVFDKFEGKQDMIRKTVFLSDVDKQLLAPYNPLSDLEVSKERLLPARDSPPLPNHSRSKSESQNQSTYTTMWRARLPPTGFKLIRERAFSSMATQNQQPKSSLDLFDRDVALPSTPSRTNSVLPQEPILPKHSQWRRPVSFSEMPTSDENQVNGRDYQSPDSIGTSLIRDSQSTSSANDFVPIKLVYNRLKSIPQERGLKLVYNRLGSIPVNERELDNFRTYAPELKLFSLQESAKLPRSVEKEWAVQTPTPKPESQAQTEDNQTSTPSSPNAPEKKWHNPTKLWVMATIEKNIGKEKKKQPPNLPGSRVINSFRSNDQENESVSIKIVPNVKRIPLKPRDHASRAHANMRYEEAKSSRIPSQESQGKMSRRNRLRQKKDALQTEVPVQRLTPEVEDQAPTDEMKSDFVPLQESTMRQTHGTTSKGGRSKPGIGELIRKHQYMEPIVMKVRGSARKIKVPLLSMLEASREKQLVRKQLFWGPTPESGSQAPTKVRKPRRKRIFRTHEVEAPWIAQRYFARSKNSRLIPKFRGHNLVRNLEVGLLRSSRHRRAIPAHKRKVLRKVLRKLNISMPCPQTSVVRAQASVTPIKKRETEPRVMSHAQHTTLIDELNSVAWEAREELSRRIEDNQSRAPISSHRDINSSEKSFDRMVHQKGSGSRRMKKTIIRTIKPEPSILSDDLKSSQSYVDDLLQQFGLTKSPKSLQNKDEGDDGNMFERHESAFESVPPSTQVKISQLHNEEADAFVKQLQPSAPQPKASKLSDDEADTFGKQPKLPQASNESFDAFVKQLQTSVPQSSVIRKFPMTESPRRT